MLQTIRNLQVIADGDVIYQHGLAAHPANGMRHLHLSLDQVAVAVISRQLLRRSRLASWVRCWPVVQNF